MPSPWPPSRPVPEPPLSARLDRRVAHVRSSRLLLRWVLLAVDGAAVRGGRDEPRVDRISDRAGRTREAPAERTAGRHYQRPGPGFRRRSNCARLKCIHPGPPTVHFVYRCPTYIQGPPATINVFGPLMSVC